MADATADARRAVQTQLSSSAEPREQLIARMDEWAIVTLSSANDAPALSVQAHELSTDIAPTKSPRIEFVGRRSEQRLIAQWLAQTSIEIHGLGGIGKSALARQVAEEVRGQGNFVAMVTGDAGIDQVLDSAADALGVAESDTTHGRSLLKARLDRIRQRIPHSRRLNKTHGQSLWDARLDRIRQEIPHGRRLILLIDGDFYSREMYDFLASWIARPELRLMYTCRLPVLLGITYLPLAPLSAAETIKLAWSLPNVAALDDITIDRAYRSLGGYPYAWTCLDELLGATTSVEDALADTIDACWRTSGAAAATFGAATGYG